MGVQPDRHHYAMHDTMKRLRFAAKEIKGIDRPTDLARLLGESRQTIKNWEERGMSCAGMLAAQGTLGCSATWLETGVGGMMARPGPETERLAWPFSAFTYAEFVGLSEKDQGLIEGYILRIIHERRCDRADPVMPSG